MKCLSIILGLAVFYGGVLYAAESQPKPEKIIVKTYYEGNIPYVLHPSGCYVRSGNEAKKKMEYDRKFSEEELGPFKETDDVLSLRQAIGIRLENNSPPEQIWEAARSILNWMHAHGKPDNDKYRILSREGWPKIETIASYYAQNQQLSWAACFSLAHLAFSLFRICDLPTDAFGIATARYKGKGEAPTHVYLGLRVDDQWYYIDPSGKMPPYAKRASVGRRMGLEPGCDYAHPLEFKTVAGGKFKGIPLLEPLPFPK
jgi:hypothetical protein